MTLTEAPLNKRLIVKSFSPESSDEISDIESRLMHLGFIHSETVRVMKKAPLFKEPLLVEVRGRSVALAASEANLVSVEVVE